MSKPFVSCAAVVISALLSLATCHGADVGDALIFPYYQASSITDTTFNIYNNQDGGSCRPVRVEIHSQGDGAVLDTFCVAMAPQDMVSFKLSRDSSGWVVWRQVTVDPNGCSMSDCNCSRLGVTTLTDEAITTAGGSSCHLSPEVGYAVAYAVDDCNSAIPSANATLAGMELIKENGMGKTYGMTARAIDVNASSTEWSACASSSLGEKRCKQALLASNLRTHELVIPYSWDRAALILTVPSFGDPQISSDWRMSGAVGDDEVTHELTGCGFLRLSDAASLFVNGDGTQISDAAPFYYPVNAVSVVNFASTTGSAGLTDARNFFAKGDLSAWGLGLVLGNMDGRSGFVSWKVPQWVDGYSGVLTVDFSQDQPTNYIEFPFRNVVATIFYAINDDLAWMTVPSQ